MIGKKVALVLTRLVPGLLVIIALGLVSSHWLRGLGDPAVAQGGPVLSVVPASSTSLPGGTVAVDVVAEDVPSVSTYQFDLVFDAGTVVTVSGSTTECMDQLYPVITPTIGSSPYSFQCRAFLPGQGMPGPDVTLAHVVFECLTDGSSALDMQQVYLVDSGGTPISPLAVNDGEVRCQPPTPTATATVPAPTPTATPTPGPSSPWADVVPFKEATPSPAESADVISYEVTVRNLGLTSALNVRLTDRVPPEATLLTYDSRCTPFADGIMCGPASLTPYDGQPGGLDEVRYPFAVRAPATSVDVDLADIVVVSAENEPSGNTGNNSLTLITKVLACPDVDGDGRVDLMDIFEIGKSWQAKRGEPGYISGRDVNQDGVIDLMDIFRLGDKWGFACP